MVDTWVHSVLSLIEVFFVGRFICIEKFNSCMSCCPLNGRCPLFRLSTNGGFTIAEIIYPSLKPRSHFFAYVMLQLEVHVNACCYARIEKISIPALSHLNHFICTSGRNTMQAKRCEQGLTCICLQHSNQITCHSTG